MRGLGAKKVLLGAICVASLALYMGVAPAQGASSEPLYVLVPSPPSPPLPIVPLPTGYFNGPCGLGVDSTGRLFVSDYYHHNIDIYSGTAYQAQLTKEDPSDGPCGMALDSTDHLYVNNYHRNVVKFNPSPSFGSGTVFPLPSEETERHLPTGVAVDPTTGNVYVDNRSFISVYESNGTPVMNGLEPLRIGVGSLGDGYGVALSQFPGTLRFLYVPDAASNTVKVYNPGVSKTTPVAEIKDPFNHPFVSLHDSAVAVDNVTGDIYFADNLQPKYTEKPQATIYIYSATGIYKGHLKYNVTDALQPGIAVDNSETPQNTQGRVYVTSGNTNQAGVYAYGPGSGTFGTPLPPTFSLTVSTHGAGEGSVNSAAAKLDCTDSCERELLSGGTDVLTATPAPGSEFSGWSGACSGAEPTCSVTLEEAASVSATFTDASPEAGPSRQADPPPAVQASPQAQPSRPARHRHRRHHRRRHHVKHRH
jgi:hypothetical protein